METSLWVPTSIGKYFNLKQQTDYNTLGSVAIVTNFERYIWRKRDYQKQRISFKQLYLHVETIKSKSE